MQAFQLLLVFAAGSVLCGNASFAQSAPSKAQLRALVGRNWERVAELEVEFTTRTATGPVQDIPNLVGAARCVFRWSADGRTYWGRFGDDGDRIEEVSYDSRVLEKRTRGEHNSGWVRYGRIESSRGIGSWWATLFLLGGLPSGHAHRTWDSDLLALLDEDSAEVRPEIEILDGRRCAVVDLRIEDVLIMTAWLDLDRSGMPLRYTRPRGGPAEVVLSDYVQIEGAVWLPMRIVQSVGNNEEDILSTTVEVIHGEAGREVRLNAGVRKPIASVEFDARTTIVNDDSGRRMVMLPDGGLAVRTNNSDLLVRADELAARNSRRASVTGLPSVSIVAIIAVALAGAWGSHRFCRQRAA